ncbi:MAG: GNAT family N-acetyltransferase [Bacteroidia bacterium]|nr:GNAT family N-acetyltransferase [Bacteroidia bacterium]
MSLYETEKIFVEQVEYDAAFDRVFQIRQSVFVEEMDVDHEDDYDGFDHLAYHYLVHFNDQSVATARWRRTQTGGRYRIERIAVLKDFRRKKIGSFLVKAILNDIPKDKEIFVHTPVWSIPFFKSLGFKESGFEFEEAGINHKKLIFG